MTTWGQIRRPNRGRIKLPKATPRIGCGEQSLDLTTKAGADNATPRSAAHGNRITGMLVFDFCNAELLGYLTGLTTI